MHVATLILLVLSVGLASQWLAWRLRVPAIVVLIATGIVLGPVTGVVDLGLSQAGFSELGAWRSSWASCGAWGTASAA